MYNFFMDEKPQNNIKNNKELSSSNEQNINLSQQAVKPSSDKIDVNTIYPEAKLNPVLNADENNQAVQNQSLAKQIVKDQSREANKPISIRVISLLFIALLLLINSAIALFGLGAIIFIGFSEIIKNITNLATLFLISIFLIYLAEFLISLYLLFAKDNYRVAFILKIILVLQAISIFRSLTNLTSIVVTGLLFILTLYVYTRVKNLNYI